MAKRKNEELEFQRDMDRLLAGEEVILGADAGEDYRTAIEFARKLTELREEPSPEFREKLKARLLMRLTEQEVASRQEAKTGWLRGLLDTLVPQTPVWRTAVITGVVLIATVGVMWRSGIFTQTPAGDIMLKGQADEAAMVLGGGAADEEEMAVAKQAEAPRVGIAEKVEDAPVPVPSAVPVPLSLRGAAGEAIVSASGDEVSIEMVFRNTAATPIIVKPFPPSVSIVGDGQLRPVRIVAAGGQSVELPALGSVSHTLVWDQQDDGFNQVAPGWYTVYAGSVTVSRGDEVTEVAFPPAARVLVQHPQGAMERVIEPGLTVVADGISITLERVDLRSRGIIITAVATPVAMLSPTAMIPVEAEFAIDGSVTPATLAEIEFLKDSLRLTWGQYPELPPAPSDARELVIRITRFDNLAGPWVFRIQLQN